MIRPALKDLGLWVSYASILIAASLAIHHVRDAPEPTPTLPVVPEAARPSAPAPTVQRADVPRRPVLTVTKVGRLDEDGEARLVFRLDGPAPRPIAISYALGDETVRRDRDFTLEPPGPLVIGEGEVEASLLLAKREPESDSANPVRARGKQGVVSVALKDAGERAFELAPGSSGPWRFPLTPTLLAGPYRATAAAPGAFQQEDARKNEERTIVLSLDRLPTAGPVTIRFELAGDADRADYEVVGPHPNETLAFSPSDGTARLTLRRLPGPRGRGDRKIRVRFLAPADGTLAVAPSMVEIGIVDPSPGLTWWVDPPVNNPEVAGGASHASLGVEVKPPGSRRIKLAFDVAEGSEKRRMSLDLAPPADPWARKETITTFPLDIPPGELIITPDADAKRTVSITAVDDYEGKLPPLSLSLPELPDGPIDGRILVVLVLTSNLTPDELKGIQATIDQIGREGLQARLVNGTLFVLDATHRLSPFRLDALKDERRFFPAGARTDELLGPWSHAIFERLRDRMTESARLQAKRVLLLRDVADLDAARLSDALSNGLQGRDWAIYWTDPHPEKSPLADTLRPAVTRMEYTFETPRGDLSKRLLEFLRQNPPK